MTSALAKTNVFQFMVVRAPNSLEPKTSQRNYIKDDDDLFSATSASTIGPMVYQKVFCADPPPVRGTVPSAGDIVRTLLTMLPFVEAGCPNPQVIGSLESLRDRNYVPWYGKFYLLPDRLRYLEAPLIPMLTSVLDVLYSPPLNPDETLDRPALLTTLSKLFDGQSIATVVFSGPNKGYAKGFAAAKRKLFDTLYLLYILRRFASVNLEHIILGLRALHVLEALAVATPLIHDLAELNEYMSATPVIHPLFARLHRIKEPFNPIRPLGIGDLKVVKQWLCGYKAGDFAHVENVLQGETKIRVHRHLEKTEDVFSSSSEKQEETQRDTQSTDRFELKREAESVIKQDLAINANAAVTYNYGGGMIVANVTAGMAYTRSQTDQNKSADNLSREVVNKAVQRIQSRASEQRATTKLFETEETNTHTLANSPGTGHISGIYRWLDKEYQAQLYNYGKRLMFEFILPEPAAFFVEARLRAYEGQIDVPSPPQPVIPQIVPTTFRPSQIDQDRFNQLRLHYDLKDLSYPVQDKTVTFKNSTTGQAFLEGENPVSKWWKSKSFSCDLQSRGYDVTALVVEGTIDFSGPGSDGKPQNDALRNLFSISLDGTQVFYSKYDPDVFHSFHTPNNDAPDVALHDASFTPYKLRDDKVELVLGVQNVAHFNLQISARLKLSDESFAEWQQVVFERVYKAEQERLDKLDAAAAQAYQAQLATYHNRLGELRATAVNDLLQGQSDAFNRELIGKELKRQCLAMITKDFDADIADDVVTKLDPMGERAETGHVPNSYTYHQLRIHESPNANAPETVDVEFALMSKTSATAFPAPRLEVAAAKARYIQFLEQAFEWQQMAYLFYPYFWATPPKWIDLMSRGDTVDANMSAFLQAGSCKVLLAVSPAYDDSVMHYLATGEPWEGGPAPVIGDPLFVPLYEELRRQQDDLDGATPEGRPWNFTVPTSLVYLENSSTPLPKSVCEETA